MEEFKPKRKNNTQPVQAGQNTGRARSSAVPAHPSRRARMPLPPRR